MVRHCFLSKLLHNNYYVSNNTIYEQIVFRYLLLDLKFASAEDGNRALKSASPKSIASLIKDAVIALHGDYGLASVLHSLNGECGRR